MENKQGFERGFVINIINSILDTTLGFKERLDDVIELSKYYLIYKKEVTETLEFKEKHEKLERLEFLNRLLVEIYEIFRTELAKVVTRTQIDFNLSQYPTIESLNTLGESETEKLVEKLNRISPMYDVLKQINETYKLNTQGNSTTVKE